MSNELVSNELVSVLSLPFEALRTMYEGASEVRLYRSNITGLYSVGKRIDTFGLEGSMLRREATWLSSIRHNNLVPVQSVAKVSDPRFPPPIDLIEMIMPFYARGSIADAFVRGERFSIAEARDHVLAVLRALGELHEVQRVLHRDVKAANVLLADDSDLVRLSDLGVAAPLSEDGYADAFRSAQIYTPPENYTGDRISRRADLYSCGMLLLEMASGPLPWAEYEDRQAMADRLASGKQAVLPRHLRVHASAPVEMRRLIRSCLSADPSKRPNGSSDMSNRLANIRLVDWREIDHDAGSFIRWEGSTPKRPDRLYRVEASKKGNIWLLQGLQRVNSWRRCVPDQEARDFFDSGAVSAFDSIVTEATSR